MKRRQNQNFTAENRYKNNDSLKKVNAKDAWLWPLVNHWIIFEFTILRNLNLISC